MFKLKSVRWCSHSELFDTNYVDGNGETWRDLPPEEVKSMRKMLKKAWKDYKKDKKNG